jgi:poly(A)-specific ribonuclease
MSLNNFQKRLVHQLVRAEFPGFVTASRGGFIQILEYEQAREDGQKAIQLKRVEERVSKQTGFRWVVEAMCGGSLAKLDPKTFTTNDYAPKYLDEKHPTIAHFKEVRNCLKLKRTVLVGHNLFTDLINFYICFFGGLPDRVEDFQRKIHDLFPVIIDTKYMATHNCGSVNPRSSLQEIEAELTHLKKPNIGMWDLATREPP